MDFTGFEAIIDRIGGIDIELTSAEAAYINKRNHTSIVAGLNHLNGAEALMYARARKIDNDFGRTERQRKVLSAMYEQAKNLSVSYASIRGMSVLVPDLPRIRQCLEEYLPLE